MAKTAEDTAADQESAGGWKPISYDECDKSESPFERNHESAFPMLSTKAEIRPNAAVAQNAARIALHENVIGRAYKARVIHAVSESREIGLRTPRPGQTARQILESGQPTSQAILTILGFMGFRHISKCRAILEAEVLDFDSEQSEVLSVYLKDFIWKNIQSDDNLDRIAVGSAIRQVMASSGGTESLDFAASVLSTPAPIDVDLEITKMLRRWLSQYPPINSNSHTKICERVKRHIPFYLDNRFIDREKHSAVALNLTLVATLLIDVNESGLVNQIRSINANWFKLLIARECRKLCDHLETKFDTNQYSRLIGSFADVIAASKTDN